VARIQPICARQREPNAVDRQRIVLAQLLQDPNQRATAHIVLGVDLKPRDLGTSAQHLGHVRRPESHASAHGEGELGQSLNGHGTLSFCRCVLYAVPGRGT
jgi:hypothetical protein